MQLQKQLSRKVDDKEYTKWVITIPPSDIALLGWKEGQNLKTHVTTEGLVVIKSDVLTYEEFKIKITNLLNKTKAGMTWHDIKTKLGLPQEVPNNSWVRRLEEEVKLQRRKEGTLTYWYLPHKSDTVVFTIGYEGKNLLEFVGVLKENGVQQVIDVRELAFSRKNGFAKSALSKALQENGIVYKHFPLLGSPRELRHKLWEGWDYPEFFKEYEEALSKPESQEQLLDLEGLAQVRKTVMMCFEKDVNKCHRSIIKKKLIRDGFRVVDI